MCKERWRTRDLLLEYDSHIMPPRPRAAGLSIIYPWENRIINDLINQLFNFAINTGYNGTEAEFKNSFGSYLAKKEIIFDVFNNFPQEGASSSLYFDLNDKILYYWDNEYKSINTLLIEGTILDAGSSTISIE